MKKTNVRKTAAIGLAFVGLAGVGIASAAQLVVGGADNSLTQAGAGDLSISLCQTTDIDARFGLDNGAGGGAGDLITGSAATFGYVDEFEVLILDSFDAPCAGKTFEVALGDSTGAEISQYQGVVPTGGGVVPLNSAGWVTPPTPGNLFDLARVSVTVYDTPTP